jgi:AraC-like DNA-binding protein
MSETRILALLDAAKLRRLTSLAGPEWRVEAASSWEDFERRSRGFEGVLVVDPPVLQSHRATGLELVPRVRDFLRGGDQPLVLYTVAARIGASVAIPRRTRIRLILQGVDDTPALIRFTLCEAAADLTTHRLVAAIRETTPQFDGRLLGVLERVLLGDTEPAGVRDLASAAGMTRSTLYQVTRATGPGSPLHLLRILRIGRAYRMVHHHGVPLSEACETLGDRTGRGLRRALRAVVGEVPASALRGLAPSDFVRLVAARLVRRA